MKNFVNELKAFIMRGNVMDMAVGIIIGVAFGAIVNSLVSDVIMPPIGLALGNLDFTNLFFNMSGKPYASLDAAVAAGAPVIKYGLFINTVINFLIIAVVVFFIVRMVNHLQKPLKKPAAVEVTTRECPYCLSTIPLKATRCPNCTSELKS
jgi:large conductance mechanosensitive channel